jgi:di/tricarboxylate transporter
LIRVKIKSGSAYIGKTLENCSLRQEFGMNLVAIERNNEMILYIPPEMTFYLGDILYLEGRLEQMPEDRVQSDFEFLQPRQVEDKDFESPKIAVVEAVLAPRSGLIGQTLQGVHFREKFGMLVLAIWRAGRPIRSGLGTMPMQFGDALLLQGPREKVKLLKMEPNLVVLSESEQREVRVKSKGWLALGIMLLALVCSVIFPHSLGEIMLTGAIGMVLFSVLTTEQAYDAVEWKSIFLIAGMLPLGIAITKTGLSDLIAQGFAHNLYGAIPLVFVSGLFLTSVVLTQVMHGAAVAAIMVPVAIQTASLVGIETRSIVMAVTLATSMAFVTPLGHPVNVLVMGMGGYQFKDYFKVGLPLTLLLFLVILSLLPIVWPL